MTFMEQVKVSISIIIPVYNNLSFTQRCLKSLYLSLVAETLPPSFEVIVVDNGSCDGTREWIEEFRKSGKPQSELIYHFHETNLGFAKACNAGAGRTSGKYLIFLNNDTEVLGDALQKLVRTTEENPGAGIVGCRLLYPNGTIQHAGMVLDPNLNWLHVFRGYPAGHPAVLERKTFQAVTGACFLISRELFIQVEKFDEGYLNSYEDVDLCFKVR